MGKKKRFITAVACAVLLAALLLGGCAGMSDAEKAEIETQVLAANAELMEAKSIRGNMFMEYSYSVSWKTYSMSMDFDFEEMSETGTAATAPDRIHITGTAAVDGTPVEMEAYMLSNDDGTQTVYSCTGDRESSLDWSIQTQGAAGQSAGQMELANGILGTDEFQAEHAETDTSEGRKALKIAGSVDTAEFAGIIAESLGIDAEDMQGAKAAYTIWLDAENKEMLQYEIDLKDVVKSALEAMLEAQGLGAGSAELQEMKVGMRVDEINGEYDFTLPDAVREKIAQEERTDDMNAYMLEYLLEQVQ